MQALLQQFLLKHGDVFTIRTLNLSSAGTPGWLYLDANETPQVANSIDLPVSDKRFQWQVLKLSPNVTGGNQNPTYITEGDDVILKSLSNGLTLSFHSKRCGLNAARAQVGEQIAIGNYYTTGQGGIGTTQFVDANGGITKDRAVVYGLRPYAIKFTGQHCFLSTPPHAQTMTAGSASHNESFILLPPWGTLSELEMRAQTIGEVPLIKQESAAQGYIDATHGVDAPFAQLVTTQGALGQAIPARAGSVMATNLPSSNGTGLILGVVVGVALIGGLCWYFYQRKAKK